MNDAGRADSASESSETGDSPESQGDADPSVQLTEKLTAPNEEGNVEVTIMAPESWYSWGPGDVIMRGTILSTESDVDGPWYFVEVRDGWLYECTPENLATKECVIQFSNYLSYETLDTITIGAYDAPGFEFVDDYDTYQTREQYRLLDVDGTELAVAIKTDAVDEDFPQVLFDIRDSLTVEFVD